MNRSSSSSSSSQNQQDQEEHALGWIAADSEERGWIAGKLAAILEVRPGEIEDCIIDNIKAYDTPHDLESFLFAFSTGDKPQQIQTFVAEMFRRRAFKSQEAMRSQAAAKVEANERHSNNSNNELQQHSNFGEKGKQQEQQQKLRPRVDEVERKGRKNSEQQQQQQSNYSLKQRRGKFAPRPETLHRRFCFCNAQSGEHQLIGNCLNCGKIVCSEEGAGPCLHCGHKIATVGSVHSPSLIESDDDGSGYDDDLGRRMEENNYDKGSRKCMSLRAALDKGNAANKQQEAEQLQRALDHRNRLLEFEQTSAQRTKVYDDSTDWFAESSNLWLSQTDRERAAAKAKEIEEKKKNAKRTRYLAFDFQSGQVTEEKPEIPEDSVAAVDEFLCEARERETNAARERFDEAESCIGPHPCLAGETRELYETLCKRLQMSTMTEAERRQQQQAAGFKWGANKHRQLGDAAAAAQHQTVAEKFDARSGRQHHQRWGQPNLGAVGRFETADLLVADDWKSVDEEIEAVNESSNEAEADVVVSPWDDSKDEGVCLSLHQPWASLIVYGLKQVEGRTWGTDYRGRLWIHAASKPPGLGDIEGCEAMYNELYGTQIRLIEEESRQTSSLPIPRPKRLLYPSEFPTSCLLGCVDLVDCMTQIDYDGRNFRGEESKSPFVFILERPRKLLLPIQMGGEHKLWKLPRDQLPHIQRSLRPAVPKLRISGSSSSVSAEAANDVEIESLKNKF